MNTTSGAPISEPRSRAGSRGRAAADARAPGAKRGPAPAISALDPLGVSIAGLSHSFEDLRVIEELSLNVAAGEVLGIVGPSGSGKTTLLELIAGLREYSSEEAEPSSRTGSRSVEGAAIEIGDWAAAPDRLARCAYMPQRDLLLPWLRAIDNAAIALRNRGLSRDDARAAAAPNFKRFGLEGFELARPDELSGGMRQRVAFLRTLLAGKPVLLLDEPFGALDAITRGEMQEWLASTLASEPRTVLFVTHDVEEALYVCDRIAILAPRPASVIAELAAPVRRGTPRIDAITDPEFTEVREQALERLATGAPLGGSRPLSPGSGGRAREKQDEGPL